MVLKLFLVLVLAWSPVFYKQCRSKGSDLAVVLKYIAFITFYDNVSFTVLGPRTDARMEWSACVCSTVLLDNVYLAFWSTPPYFFWFYICYPGIVSFQKLWVQPFNMILCITDWINTCWFKARYHIFDRQPFVPYWAKKIDKY